MKQRLQRFLLLLSVALLSALTFTPAVHAAIDLTLDVQALATDANTTSKQVNLQRVELVFANGRSSVTVPRDSKGLYAIATLKYVGNGALRVRWKVDGRVVSQYSKLFTFGRAVTFRSDQNGVALPSFEPGFHRVSVELFNAQGQVASSTRAIRYFVSKGVGDAVSTEQIRLMYPSNMTLDASREFHFRWQGPKQIEVYQIEVESIANKAHGARRILSAFSNIDVYKPSLAQRADFRQGRYRWRVKGLFRQQKAPQQSAWHEFTVEGSRVDGGVFISSVQALDNADLSAGSRLTSVKVSAITSPRQNWLRQSAKILKRQSVTAGQPFNLQLQIDNSSLKNSDRLQLQVSKNGQIMATYPVAVGAGQQVQVDVPLQTESALQASTSLLDIQLVAAGRFIDDAQINLTEIPKLRLDALDFQQINPVGSGGITVDNPFGCSNRPPPNTAALSRMVSARDGQTSQTLLQQGYFQFDQGQRISFTAYFEDQGLGEWFRQSVLACDVKRLLPGQRNELENNLQALGGEITDCRHQSPKDWRSKCAAQIAQANDIALQLRRDDMVAGKSLPLQFIAQPLDTHGEVNAAPIEIGEVVFERNQAGLIDSPQWTIPRSGQYKISLNGFGSSANLYATRAGGLPLYLNAGGFELDLQTLSSASSITSLAPRQALLSGRASAPWRGDASAQLLEFDFENIAVSLLDPLHGVLNSGTLNLDASPRPRLQLLGETLQLRTLALTAAAARADLSYTLPGDFIQQGQQRKSIHSLPVQAVSQSAASASNAPGNVLLNQVDIFNGGEFIARYPFDAAWGDVAFKQGDLGLRLRGGELLIDASTHLNYEDYQQAPGFTGIGLRNVMLRARVNSANHLPSVLNSANAFLYGKAGWLGFSADGLSGENIAVRPSAAVAHFFGENPDSEWQLRQPFGFSLKVNGGVFSLENSVIGGLDLAGYFRIPDSVASGLLASSEINFAHLVRRRSPFSQQVFVTEMIQNPELKLDNGVFNYQPARLKLLIGVAEERESGAPPAPNFDWIARADQQGLNRWLDAYSDHIVRYRSGLLLQQGVLDLGWRDNNSAADVIDTRAAAFFVDSTGLSGYWLSGRNTRHYLVNGFDTQVDAMLLQFEQSALIDSRISGRLQIPYPVQQTLLFNGQLDQEANLLIARTGLRFSESTLAQGALELPYWHARLNLPAALLQNDILASSIGGTIVGLSGRRTNTTTPALVFDAENQRIMLNGFTLDLLVDDALGGAEIITANQSAPFNISTAILANGQLDDTRISATGDLFFIGQPFTPMGEQPVQFQPYSGTGKAPDGQSPATAEPLITVSGEVNFSVFGPHEVSISHTALGARVNRIEKQHGSEFERAVGENIEDNWNTGPIKVAVDLRFVNTYGLFENGNTGLTDDDGNALPAAHYKAFVGTADLSLIDALSIKGLAEAGLHAQQSMRSGREDIAQNGIWAQPMADIKAYERIGLGAGVDTLKAAIAGVRGLETATRIGEDVVTQSLGITGAGEKVVDLGLEAVTFIESVGMAVATNIPPASAPSEIVHAVDNGLATTNSAIELLKFLCEEQGRDSDCRRNDVPLFLDILSLLTRSTSAVLHVEELATNPKEVASLSLQTLDVAIPVLQGEALENAAKNVGLDVSLQIPDENLNSMKNAALTSAHVVVGAARRLVDQDMQLSFRDIVAISRRSVTAMQSISEIPVLRSELGDNAGLMDLSVTLAGESISLIEDLQQNPDITRLQRVAADYLKLLCLHSDQVEPLLRQVGLQQVSQQVLKPSLGLSASVLEDLNRQGLPQHEEQIISRFLVSLLNRLAQGSISVEGCQSSTLAAQLPLLKPVFRMAAHSLLPLTGDLQNEGELIAWALDGVNLSIQATDSFAEALNVTIPIQTDDLGALLQTLSDTFATSSLDLSDSDKQQQAEAVLTLAGQLPQAFRVYIAEASSEAAELLDLYSVLMQELLQLLQKPAEQRSVADAIALPISLINETQDLSLLNQQQKFALSNLAHLLFISREITRSEPSLRAINDHLQTLYGNIVALDQSGALAQLDVAALFAMMDILAEATVDPQQTLVRFNQHLAQLLPLIVGSSTQLLEPVQAVVTALPIVDFTQDDLTPTLDATLLRLLSEAQTKSANPDTVRAIRKARAIISHADLPMNGLSMINDAQGNTIGAKETRPDGSYREVQFPISGAKQFFPQGHPDQPGGLDEVLLGVLDGEWNQLAPADQASLFTDFWNELFGSAQSSEVVTRKYRDADNNLIEVETVEAGSTYVVKVSAAVTAGLHQPYQIFLSDTAPAIGSPMNNVVAQSTSILEAGYALPFTSTAQPTFCEFGGGCFVTYLQTGMVKVEPLHRKDFYAIYVANQDAPNIEDIAVIGLQQFKGRISAEVDGWNPGWMVDFIKGLERVTLQSSSGSYDLLQLDAIDSVDSLAAMARLIMGDAARLMQRVRIDGDDAWNYIIGEYAMHRNRASGDWALYDMPDALPVGLRIPAPDELIPLGNLTLQIAGGRDGVTDDPANLQGQISGGVLSLPVENSDEEIVIPVSGDTAGEAITNGVPTTVSGDLAEAGIDPAQVESSASRTTAAGAETPMQGTRVEAADGSTASVTSSENGRLKILRLANPDHRRSVSIKFCMQNKTLATCAPKHRKTYRFNYQWGQGPAGEINFLDFDFSRRPTITPASGANQAMKHQLWLEIFNLENELFSDPTTGLLDRLDTLVQQGRTLALAEDELQAVSKYMSARVINRLLDIEMKEYEANVDDPAKLAYWRKYPQQSPTKTIGDLLKRARDMDIQPDNQMKVWEDETLRLQVAIDLMEIQRAIDDPELAISDKLQKTGDLTQRLLDRKAGQMLQGDEDVQINDACEYLQPLSDFLEQQVLADSNFIPSTDDMQFIIKLEAANQLVGCTGASGSSIAEIGELAMNLNMGANADTPELLHSAVGLDKLLFAIKYPLNPKNAFIFHFAQVEFNASSQLYNPDADDVISIFIQQVLQQLNDQPSTPDPSSIAAPTLEKVDQWMTYYFAIDTVERMMLQEKNRREAASETVYFYPGNAGQRKLQPLREIMLERLKQTLIEAYQQRVDDFIVAGETTDLEKIDAIVTLREKIVSINKRMASVRDPLIELGGLVLRDAGNATPDVLARISNRQQQWFNQQFWRKAGSDTFIAIWQKLNAQNEVLLYLRNTLPDNLKSSVPDYYNPRVSQKLVEDMQDVSQALAQAQSQAEIDAAVLPLPEIDQFLKTIGFDDAYADFKQRGEALIAEAIERIKTRPDTVETEIDKIVAIRNRLNGVGTVDPATALNNASSEVAAALDAADQSLQAQIRQTTDLDIARPLINKVMAIYAARELLGLEKNLTSVAEIVSLLEPFRDRMEQQLEQSKDLDKIAPYLDLLASMQLMGATSIEVFSYDAVINVVAYHRDAVLQCRSNNSCTITHVRRALELEAGLASLGANEDDSVLAEISALIESQSVAMKRSLRLDQEMPDVQALVYQDKTGHRGRLAAAITLQRLGNSLTVNDEAGRLAVASVIRRLRQLAQMPLPSGSVKPQPADDPLITSANELQQRIDDEVARLQGELETILLSTTLTPDNISSVAQQLGTSEQELTDTLLPAVNGSDQITRIVPGNKYRLAAAELESHQPTQEPWLALSYRLMDKLPDPAITAEGDYRLAAASQLAIYILRQSSATVSASAADLSATAQGRLLAGLMTLPAQPDFASGMVTLLKDEVLAPMLSGESGFDCAASDIPCTLFDGGLSALGIVLDDLIAHTQDTPAEGVAPTRILALLQNISSALAQDGSWLGYAGQGLGIGLNLVSDPANAQASVAADGLALVNGMLQSSVVTGFVEQLPQPAPLGFNLVSQSSNFIEASLRNSNSLNLPVALAGIAAKALDDSLRPHSPPLADFTRELNQWSLAFADDHWTMVTDSLQRNNAEDWLAAFNANGGIGTLTCRVNKLNLLGEIQVPPALALTPFTTAQSLYNNRSKLRQTDQSPKVLADLAADLSNLLFVAQSDCENIGVAQEQALAKLLRPLGDIDLNELPAEMAVEIFGNLAVGGIEALLPGSAFARVSQLTWSGQVTANGDPVGAGVKDFLQQAVLGSAADPATVLAMVETIPLTGAKMLEEISDPNDPAAQILRILSGNVTRRDLLPPDRLLGADPVYKLPHSMLALLGEVRRGFTPAEVSDFVDNADWGYLKTVPLISRNASGQVEIGGDFVASFNQMAADAMALNAPGVMSTGGGVVRKTLVAGADIARMGINGIAPLLDLDASGQQAVAAIQQRAIFSELAAETPGFSGISGGLQREWEAGDSELGDITVQMYGQLVWPFLGRQVGLMTLATQGNDASLNFEMVAATEGVGDLFGGLTGEFAATLAFADNEQGARELGLSFFGTQKLEILSNTIGEASMSGYINDLTMAQSSGQSVGQYAVEQAMKMDAGMCGSLETQIVPFPLSLTGISGTATVGSFAEKNNTDLALGMRVGLSGSIKFPGFNSLLGLTLGGSVTQGYSVEITEGNLFPDATIQQCINPRFTLTVAGKEFDLSGFNLRAEAFTEGNQFLPVASGIKLRFALNSELLGAIKDALTCDAAINAINPFCNTLKVMQNGSMWVVLRNQVIPALQQQIMVGIGKFPDAGQASEFPFIEGKVNVPGSVPNITLPSIKNVAGSWGGFHEAQGAEICSKNLCNINEEIGL
jgi:hypothetical protein